MAIPLGKNTETIEMINKINAKCASNEDISSEERKELRQCLGNMSPSWGTLAGYHQLFDSPEYENFSPEKKAQLNEEYVKALPQGIQEIQNFNKGMVQLLCSLGPIGVIAALVYTFGKDGAVDFNKAASNLLPDARSKLTPPSSNPGNPMFSASTSPGLAPGPAPAAPAPGGGAG